MPQCFSSSSFFGWKCSCYIFLPKKIKFYVRCIIDFKMLPPTLFAWASFNSYHVKGMKAHRFKDSRDSRDAGMLRNKAGYTAVRCVPLDMTLLAACLVAHPSSPPPLPPSSPLPSPYPPLTIPWPYPSTEVQNTRFAHSKKTGYGPTDGPTDGPADGRTDRRTDGRTRPLIDMRSRI